MSEHMRELLRDAQAGRDRLRAEVADLLPEADAKQHFATRALRAEERLDRMRFDVQQLRDRLRQLDPGAFVLASDVAEALGDMLEEP